MDSNQNITIDEWDIKLDRMIVDLKACQDQKNFKSCSDCAEFFECELRKKYVIAVYESMNKGAGGGFEF